MARTFEKGRAGIGAEERMPGEAARPRSKVPTAKERNKDYGKGGRSGAVVGQGKGREQSQEEAFEMKKRNH